MSEEEYEAWLAEHANEVVTKETMDLIEAYHALRKARAAAGV